MQVHVMSMLLCSWHLEQGLAHSRCSIEGRNTEINEAFALNRVEDHDDLMPIFLRYDTILRETYGEYFLAELIEAQDEENHAVVCEVGD